MAPTPYYKVVKVPVLWLVCVVFWFGFPQVQHRGDGALRGQSLFDRVVDGAGMKKARCCGQTGFGLVVGAPWRTHLSGLGWFDWLLSCVRFAFLGLVYRDPPLLGDRLLATILGMVAIRISLSALGRSLMRRGLAGPLPLPPPPLGQSVPLLVGNLAGFWGVDLGF